MKKIPISVKGRYSVTTRNMETNELVKEKCVEVDNVVTLEGKHWIIFNNDNAFDYSMTGRRGSANPSIQFGTGSSAITGTDTALSGTVITKGSSYVPTVAERANGTLTLHTKMRAVFAPGEATGTFGQVGIFRSALLAGQQIKDDLGNPVTLTFLATEEVTVEYSLYHSWPCDPTVTSIDNQLIVNSVQVDVGGQLHTCNILGFATLLSGSNTRALDNDSTSMFPPWNRYTYNNNMRGYKISHSDQVDSGFSLSTVYMNTGTGLETITKGAVYRQRGFLNLDYSIYQNRYIKYIYFGGDSYDGVNYGSSQAIGTLHFDLPIFKGQGDELNIEFFIEYEIT